MRNGFDALIGTEFDRVMNRPGAGKGIDRKRQFRKVAREMESIFAYQLLKIMRQVSDSMAAEKKGIGYNTYMSMFDMEVSRIMSERGLGLQDAIVQWLERTPGATPHGDGK